MSLKSQSARSPKRVLGSRRPRVLFLTCHLPWPPISGGRRRELELIKRLSNSFDVHLVAVSKTIEQDLAQRPGLQAFCDRIEVFAADPLPVTGSGLDGLEPVLRHRCPAASARVAEILTDEAIDLVHVEGFYLMQHVPQDTELPVLLVEQNVEYDLERQRIAAAGSPPGLGLGSLRARSAEIGCWRRATRLAAVTPEDRQMMRAARPEAVVGLVPDGADHVLPPSPERPVALLARPSSPLVVFVANFGYAPNVDAALHLHGEILPLVRRRIPDVHLWLVGNAPPAQVQALQDGRVRVTGRVPDVVPYLDVADVVVCPLRIGGGIKVKAIEALRRGKALVCTPVAAQGLPLEARNAVALANGPQAFADAVAGVVLEPGRRTALEQRATRAAASLPSWDQAAAALTSVYGEMLAPADLELDSRSGGLAVAGVMA